MKKYMFVKKYILKLMSAVGIFSLLIGVSQEVVGANELVKGDNPEEIKNSGNVPEGFYQYNPDEIGDFTLSDFYNSTGTVFVDGDEHYTKVLMGAANHNETMFGVDVSKWQGDINWAQMKAKGVEFAFIKATGTGYAATSVNSDTMYMDPKFVQNITNAYSNGIKVGVYHFSQAITIEEGIAEANYILNIIAPYRHMITLPVVCDYEHVSASGYSRLRDAFNSGKLKAINGTQIVMAFSNTVRAAGYEPMVYANLDDMYYANSKQKVLPNTLNSNGVEIWLARWTNDINVVPEYLYGTAKETEPEFTYRVWQYSNIGDGRAFGAGSSALDLNIWYKNPYNDPNIYFNPAEIKALGYKSQNQDDNHIFYVDGKPYQSEQIEKSETFAEQAYNGDNTLYYTLYLPQGDRNPHVVSLYNYDSKGLPIGMTTWFVTYNPNMELKGIKFGAYNEPQKQEALTDLLAYKGTSMRVKDETNGKNGSMKLFSGIKTDVKNAMMGKGDIAPADGFVLKEYGTISNLAANITDAKPLALTTSGILKGRALLQSGSAYTEMTYSVGKDGYTVFMNPLSGILSDTGAKGNVGADFSYRAYAQITKDKKTYTIYGPVMSRSLKTLAGKIIAAGEFSAGTPEYEYVYSISHWGE